MSSFFSVQSILSADWRVVMGVTLAGAALASCVSYRFSRFTSTSPPPLRACPRTIDEPETTINLERNGSEVDKQTKSLRFDLKCSEAKPIKKKKHVRFDLEQNKTKVVERWFHRNLDRHFDWTRFGQIEWIADGRADEDEDGTITMNRFQLLTMMDDWK